MNRTIKELISQLRDLQSMWRETEQLLKHHTANKGECRTFRECREELGQILDGDLGPIEKWKSDEGDE
jgi:hypothetical protein